MYLCHCLIRLSGINFMEEWLLMQANDMKRFLALMRNHVGFNPIHKLPAYEF